MLHNPSVAVKPHILVPEGVAQSGSCCCSGNCKISCGCNVNHNSQPWQEWPSKETTAAWRHFLHPDYLRGMQVVSLSQGSEVAASGWQLCTALSWGNADLLKQIPVGPSTRLCIYLIKLLEDLSESIWAHCINWARTNLHLMQGNKLKNVWQKRKFEW